MKLRTALLALTVGIVAFTPVLDAAAQTMPMPTKQTNKQGTTPDATPMSQNRTQPAQDQQGKMGPGKMGPGKMGPGKMGPGRMGPGNMGPGQMGRGSAQHSKMRHKKHVRGHKPANNPKTPE